MAITGCFEEDILRDAQSKILDSLELHVGLQRTQNSPIGLSGQRFLANR